jgi:hypothetical protein
VREDLPRIKWANPTVAVEVTPVRDQPWGSFTPTMVVERGEFPRASRFSPLL